MLNILYFLRFTLSLQSKRIRFVKIQKISVLALPLLLAGCSASKYVQEGEYILNKGEVKSDSAEYDAGALKQYVRQKEKPKLFALFKNPFSKKPVIYDSIQARLTCQDLLTAMQNQGFLHAGVSLYTTVHGEDWANAGTRKEMVEGLLVLIWILQSSIPLSGASTNRILVYFTACRRAKLLYVRCRAEAL